VGIGVARLESSFPASAYPEAEQQCEGHRQLRPEAAEPGGERRRLLAVVLVAFALGIRGEVHEEVPFVVDSVTARRQ
jgi:hypothetical protein